MVEIVEAAHSLIGLIHLAREVPGFVRENPGLSAILVVLALTGILGALLIGRVRPVNPPSIR
jgi:hypothetical protein